MVGASQSARVRVACTSGGTKLNKTIGELCKARFVGLAKVRAQTTFIFAAYNLTRIAIIFGWRLSAGLDNSARVIE